MNRNHDRIHSFCGPLQVRGGRVFQRRGMVIRDLGPVPVLETEADDAEEPEPRAPIDLGLARFLRELRRDLETR
jgi:hypothetical protein